MRFFRVVFIMVAALVNLVACGGDSNGGSDDPQNFTQSILLKNGESKTGKPPSASNTTDAPKVFGNPKTIIEAITNVVKIPTIISAQSALSKIFLQIAGDENRFFEITPTSALNASKTEEGGLRVEFEEVIEVTILPDFPQNLLDKQFCALISAQDDDGFVSRSAEPTCLEVSNTQTPNVAPIADPGPNLGVRTGSEARLDGTNSFDPDGDAITYAWSLTNKPAGSNASLNDPTAPITVFTPDIEGQYVVQLVVSDSNNFNSHTAIAVVVTSPDNTTPLANAGPDRNVETGTLVSLDGSESTDADGQPLTFNWTLFVSPSGSTATLDDASLPIPSFSADVDGQYVLALVVNDGIIDSVPDTVIVTASMANVAPIANAGPDAPAVTGIPVTLDGSNSSDANNDPLIYRWSLKSSPLASQSQLDNPTSDKPSFTPDAPGDYVIELIVNDGMLDSKPDTVVIMAGSGNNPPLADAGADQEAIVGQTVQLDGSNSSDLDNNPLTFLWTFNARPPASNAQLVDPSSVNPSFVPDVAGRYDVELVVNNGTVDSQPDTVVVNVTDNSTNPIPIANAGPDQANIIVGTQVNLDGSQSADPQGEDITFQWTLQSKPNGSLAILVNETTPTPSFTPDVAGGYDVQLVVTDAIGQTSIPNRVIITTQGQ